MGLEECDLSDETVGDRVNDLVLSLELMHELVMEPVRDGDDSSE